MRNDVLVGYLAMSPMFPGTGAITPMTGRRSTPGSGATPIYGGIDKCEADLAEGGGAFVFDLTDEAVKLLHDARSNVQPSPKCNCRSKLATTRLPTLVLRRRHPWLPERLEGGRHNPSFSGARRDIRPLSV
jgi:hypothetical protein